MSVIPRITAGGVVQLQIEQEVSSLVNANVEGAADLITNRRAINTTVLADDGGTVVLGGLITDDQISQDQRVPGLSNVPVLGNSSDHATAGRRRERCSSSCGPRSCAISTTSRKQPRTGMPGFEDADAAEPPRSLLDEQEVRSLPLEIQGLY
jgi:general secretion pathway protein D